jgi:hypothetical protein
MGAILDAKGPPRPGALGFEQQRFLEQVLAWWGACLPAGLAESEHWLYFERCQYFYQGELLENEPQGPGVCVDRDTEFVYQGSFSQGWPDGQGLIYY